ncbi:MAG: DUF4160 domain-containing protein [Flavobacteriaceae bacterium]|jgi:hypothetical protein|nr:DUF4160 domain-containing protein [Flavobacteriaceae bacterium]
MPKILIYKKLIFFFFAGDINERGHLHIAKSKDFSRVAKIWFENGVEIFEKGSLTQKELTEAKKIVEKNKDFIITQWNNFKKQGAVKLKQINKL